MGFNTNLQLLVTVMLFALLQVFMSCASDASFAYMTISENCTTNDTSYDIGCYENWTPISSENSTMNDFRIPILTTHTAVSCAQHWTLFGGMCYKVFGEENKTTWKQASKTCSDVGGNLATIHSKDLQEFLVKFLLVHSKSNLWIGLNDIKNESIYTWDDGSEDLSYTNWDVRQPSGTTKNNENCVEMRYKRQGHWNDASCSREQPFLCQTETSHEKFPLDPRFCGGDGGGYRYSNSCYHLQRQRLSWEDAERYCIDNYGGHLASILDSETEKFFTHITSSTEVDFWIGVKLQEKPVQKWSSDWLVMFRNWKDQNKHFIDGTCSLLSSLERVWHDVPCHQKHYFVCETSEDKPPVLKEESEGFICPDVSNGWDNLPGEYCYYLETQKVSNWHEAYQQCIKKGGRLATIHSASEANVLLAYLFNMNKRLLIGLQKNLSDSDSSEWFNVTNLDYEYFLPEEPLNQTCGELWTESMTWKKVSCSSEGGYICSAKKIHQVLVDNNKTSDGMDDAAAMKTVDNTSDNNGMNPTDYNTDWPALKTVGIAVGVALAFVLLLVLAIISIKYWRKSRMSVSVTQENISENMGCVFCSTEQNRKHLSAPRIEIPSISIY